jgi:release factor glutamine methyltransferase
MDKNSNTINSRNNAPTFLVFFLFLLSMAGCSQHNNDFKLLHPGKYDLIDLGKVDGKPDGYHSYKVHDRVIYSHPLVTHPSNFSVHLLEHTKIHQGESVLDIGTGTGVQAMFAADKASHVLAMDINEQALKNTLLNARRLVWNERTEGNWKLHERFFLDAGKHLKPNGRIYFSTGNLDNMSRTKILAEKNGFKVIHIDMTYSRIQHIETIVYVFKHADAAMWSASDLEKAKLKN